ncbi:MAG TPA: methyltransferase [Streptosporangiaceae bacterium]|nr:methyltransferase [Streptosporangiaceae bacterium]
MPVQADSGPQGAGAGPPQIERYGDIVVYWRHELNGGGRSFGQQVVDLVGERIGPVAHAFEWCSGPGFIGFSLLAQGLCRRLTLADVNPAAVEVARSTVARNGLGDRVAVHLSDCLDAIPECERWNLVVGNPPHLGENRTIPEIRRPELIYVDADWRLHRRFYGGVRARLAPGADVVIQENGEWSSPDDFRSMIDDGGLVWVDAIEGRRGFYCIWSRNPS